MSKAQSENHICKQRQDLLAKMLKEETTTLEVKLMRALQVREVYLEPLTLKFLGPYGENILRKRLYTSAVVAKVSPVYKDENKLWRIHHNENLSWFNMQYKDGTFLIDQHPERNIYSVELPNRINRVDVVHDGILTFKMTFSGDKTVTIASVSKP
jgi:hypothetical protein